MRTNKLAAVPAAIVLAIGGAIAVDVVMSTPAYANECKRGGDYGEFTTDEPATIELCDGTKKETGTPKPTPTTTKPTVQTKPKPTVQSKPKPTVQSKPKPTVQSKPKPVVLAEPQPKKVVRQDAKPPAKISATATKVCIVRVPVKNSGGTTATVRVGKKTVTVAPGKTVTVEVPVRPDGTWSIKVTGPGYSKVFKGGCDCAKQSKPTVAAVAAADLGQNAVPSDVNGFPWLITAGALILGAAIAFPVARSTARKPAPAKAKAKAQDSSSAQG